MLLDLWAQGMTEPLPLPFKTAWVARRTPNNVALTYEGGFMLSAEGADPCLRRVYPDFETLVKDGRFEQLSKRLMTPLIDWVTHSVKVLPHGVDDDMANEVME